MKRFCAAAILTLSLMPCFGLVGAAQADCTALVTMFDGKTLSLKGFGASDDQGVSFLPALLVTMDEGQVTLNLASLKSMSQETHGAGGAEGRLRFSFVGAKGETGIFTVDNDFEVGGYFSLGDWRSPLAKIKRIDLSCKPGAGQ